MERVVFRRMKPSELIFELAKAKADAKESAKEAQTPEVEQYFIGLSRGLGLAKFMLEENRLEQYEKALDKACKQLERYANRNTSMNEWKEWCMQE